MDTATKRQDLDVPIVGLAAASLVCLSLGALLDSARFCTSYVFAAFQVCGYGLLGFIGLFVLGMAFCVAVVTSLSRRDWFSTASFAHVNVAATYAAWAYLTYGVSAPSLFALVYDFPPSQLNVRPIAIYGSLAIVAAAPATLLAYGLLRGGRKHLAGLVWLSAVVVLLLLIRLIG